MADVAQLVRALVCGTRCRRFESDLPPHLKASRKGRFFMGVVSGENRRSRFGDKGCDSNPAGTTLSGGFEKSFEK